ncbi:restriction endonuclease [Acidothermus cellulolyticus 11B]|uniref:Restriction endonuclease n=1 Tax=Acidothermus cellulolyticus (strain ATCC 43068 / DSM 8971 / 11B) TaxID=351607 RepID=A0LQV2_ACIC1|nr:restriction endonuclease [Acidothermus cellulolyticus]ABK51812.1 restriction endonuclease [Acidothermus cellulolyticus 11B]
MAVVTIPQYHELMWPVLIALRKRGGSATIKEIYEQVVEDEHFSEEQQAVPTKDGRMSELEYRLHWARTHLKGIGAIQNSTRGVWSLTEKGQTITPEQMRRDTKAYRDELLRRAKQKQPSNSATDQASDDELDSWKEQLIARLLRLPPHGFERLAQRLLREAGFVYVTVLGTSGDGGIDGVGVYRLSPVSFPVYFQCKRYKGSVTAGVVRDFRGAMAGRGDKVLLITTGSFTKDAQNEASRDGAPPVELIDGDRLCDLLRDYRLGVDVRGVSSMRLSSMRRSSTSTTPPAPPRRRMPDTGASRFTNYGRGGTSERFIADRCRAVHD